MSVELAKFDPAQREFRNLALSLANFVITALDAELRRMFLRKKYFRIDRSCPYLSNQVARSTEKFMIDETSDDKRFLEVLKRLFFQSHKPKNVNFGDLHNYAIAGYVSRVPSDFVDGFKGLAQLTCIQR